MALSLSSFRIESFLLAVFLFLTTIFFLLPHRSYQQSFPAVFTRRSLLVQLQSPPPPAVPTCSDILYQPAATRCAFALSHCRGDSDGLLNYAAVHFCAFSSNTLLSVPSLVLILIFHFYFLVRVASDHFSPVVSRLSTRLELSPSMGAVTLLALGNGAPDVFASVAAVRGGHARTGFGAILSAGAFVSAFVVGFVAIHAAPFAVDPAPFVRDVFFYLLAASALFYIYLSAEIYMWQAVGLIAFYLFFVGIVFWMDLGGGDKKQGNETGRPELVHPSEALKNAVKSVEDVESGAAASGEELLKPNGSASLGLFRTVAKIWEVPVSTVLRLTIPSGSPALGSRFYSSANVALCPLIIIYALKSILPLHLKIVFFIPHIYMPIWLVVLVVGFFLGFMHYIFVTDHPESESVLTVLVAFIISVFWISTMAGELLNCLAAIGTILDLPPALLGLTVLAWGNSVGDLVADVAVAKAGQPAMAMAGCFAGPMFNMLIGLGTALVIETSSVYPGAYELLFNVSIVVAFVFLLLSLMGSLLVVTWFRFRVPRVWGFCLVGLYIFFTILSFGISKL